MASSSDFVMDTVKTIVEREMGQNQRGAVDTCFEEGQHASAIVLLEQLRSPSHKPSIPHVRQLLYISLHSAATPSYSPAAAEKFGGEPFSPSKPSKSSKSAATLDSVVVLSARRLLMSFAITNTPESLARALPGYRDPVNNASFFDEDFKDCPIAQEAMCIKDARTCWEILADDFVKRRSQLFSPSKSKALKRRSVYKTDCEFIGVSPSGDRRVVGEDAWPILDWLLILFERDEVMTQANGSPRHSPLLMQQIPAPRSGVGLRWDADSPLNIVTYSYQQSDLRRIMMGSRLMTLLINLSMSGHFDLPLFVASLSNRLASSSHEEFLSFFSNLGTSPTIHRFKIALCQKLLIGNGPSIQGNGRPKPQVRVQPRAVQPQSEVARSTTAPSPGKFSLPRPTEFMRLMGLDVHGLLPSPEVQLWRRIKFELLLSYGTLQSQASEMDRDVEWSSLLLGADLKQTLDKAFSREIIGADEPSREAVDDVLSMW